MSTIKKNTTTGEQFSTGPLRELLLPESMEQWEDRNAPITADIFGRRGRDNERQLTRTILSLPKIHRVVEYFELNRSRLEFLPATKNHQGLGDSEDESGAMIISVPDSETGQQSAPHIQLELMPRKPQQGNADRGLVELTN